MGNPAVPIKMLEEGTAKEAIDIIRRKIRKRVEVQNQIGSLCVLDIDVNEPVNALSPAT
jgi:hypothetical protein